MDDRRTRFEWVPIPSNLPVLGHGSHRAGSSSPCAMEAASWIAGEPWSDQPRSLHPVIGGVAQRVNDTLDDDERQLFRSLILASLDTAHPHRPILHRRLWWFAGHELRSNGATVATWQATLERLATLTGAEVETTSLLAAQRAAGALLVARRAGSTRSNALSGSR